MLDVLQEWGAMRRGCMHGYSIRAVPNVHADQRRGVSPDLVSRILARISVHDQRSLVKARCEATVARCAHSQGECRGQAVGLASQAAGPSSWHASRVPFHGGSEGGGAA
eukprot:733000-Rhodomonas_salina.4